MVHRLTARVEAGGTLLLLILITGLVVAGYIEHRDRQLANLRSICAIRAYIEGQFTITASKEAGTPQSVIAARRKVIQEFEDRMDGNCKEGE